MNWLSLPCVLLLHDRNVMFLSFDMKPRTGPTRGWSVGQTPYDGHGTGVVELRVAFDWSS